MNLKKLKIISFFGIVALSFLCHFMYDWFPNPVFSIIFPVNESIWEHMKIIITSVMLYGIIDYILIKKFKVPSNNFLLSLLLCSLIGIVLYLIIYIPLFSIFGENMFISISLLIIIDLIISIISYKLLSNDKINIPIIITVILIALTYSLFGMLTYKPFKTLLFYDMKDGIYGIK